MIANDKSTGNAKCLLTEDQLRAAQRVAEAHAARATAVASRVARETSPTDADATAVQDEKTQVFH